jgi:hypothetical protein
MWRLYLLSATLSSTAVPIPASGQVPQESVCPPQALAPLAIMRGRWRVTWLDRVAPERYVTSQGRATIESVAGGCGLLERFDGTRSARGFHALSLIAAVGADSLQRVWQDSDHGALLLFEADTREHPLRFEWSRDLGDRILRLRLTYRVLTGDAVTTETELSPDGGTTWELVTRLEYRRDRP